MVTSRPLYHLHASSSSVLRFAFSSTRSEISESSSPIPFPLRDRLDMDVTVAPLKRCKILHLVRHAQGVHNVAGEKDHGALMSPTLFDAQLSPLGWQQVSNLREHVLESGLLKRIELLVTSPLLRTMQTAVGVFGGKSQTEGLDLPPLMEANVGGCGLPAISSSDCPPFIAVELCRERLGLHPCDKRRSISESRPLFPAIDFSLIERDEDDLWQADVRESFEDIIARGMKFLSWLRTRKETEIAVVSHSVFLHQMLNALGNDSHEICKKFDNGELRSLVIFDER